MNPIAINPKLLTLPIDALFKLKAELEEVAKRRRHEVYRVGRLVTFPDKAGLMVIARIEKFGPKRMVCQVLDAKGFPVHVSGKWRVTPEYCQPVFGDPFAKPAPIPLRTEKDRPSAAPAAAW